MGHAAGFSRVCGAVAVYATALRQDGATDATIVWFSFCCMSLLPGCIMSAWLLNFPLPPTTMQPMSAGHE